MTDMNTDFEAGTYHSGSADTHTLYQHGTLALLVPGLLDGTLSMRELLEHGDTGIGTGEGLDGELVILHGVPYQLQHDGRVVEVGPDFTLPFANAHFADFRDTDTVADMTPKQLTDLLLEHTGWANTFFSATVTGTFSAMRTRAIAKHHRPYPTLQDAAAGQHVFTRELTRGTLLLYYSPQVFNGAAVGGFHIHYLADDHAIGGHALDFHVVQGQVAVQRFDTLEQHLPVSSQAYLEHDFSQDDIAGAIAASE